MSASRICYHQARDFRDLSVQCYLFGVKVRMYPRVALKLIGLVQPVPRGEGNYQSCAHVKLKPFSHGARHCKAMVTCFGDTFLWRRKCISKN